MRHIERRDSKSPSGKIWLFLFYNRYAAVTYEHRQYGRIICRCQTITEGEILAALHSPIPPRSINAVKRRTGAGMGRCQGGFCSPRVHELIARELGIDPLTVCLEDEGSELLVGETKMGGAQ